MSQAKKQFGKRLRYLRRDRDLTQEQLAEKIGMSVNFISMLERGILAPSFETLEKLSLALDVEMEDLFKFNGNRPTRSA